ARLPGTIAEQCLDDHVSQTGGEMHLELEPARAQIRVGPAAEVARQESMVDHLAVGLKQDHAARDVVPGALEVDLHAITTGGTELHARVVRGLAPVVGSSGRRVNGHTDEKQRERNAREHAYVCHELEDAEKEASADRALLLQWILHGYA